MAVTIFIRGITFLIFVTISGQYSFNVMIVNGSITNYEFK